MFGYVLQEMYTGCIKYVRFKRELFAGTKWAMHESDVAAQKTYRQS